MLAAPARRRTAGGLVTLGLRVPPELSQHLRALAAAHGISLSDAFRAHITAELAKPLGRPAPQRARPKRLAPASGADQRLLNALGAIGNNVNQISRHANRARSLDMQVLIHLQAIGQQLHALAEQHDQEPRP